MRTKQETMAFIQSRTPEQLDEIAAKLIEDLVDQNARLKREIKFLRGIMESFVVEHEQAVAVARLMRDKR